MDLKVSYNWLREYLPGLKATPEEIAEKLSLHAFSVERWRRTDEGLERIVVGKIVKIESHPNADKLKVVFTDIVIPAKAGIQSVDSRFRGSDKAAKIVCGG